jgi:hypothetical protein
VQALAFQPLASFPGVVQGVLLMFSLFLYQQAQKTFETQIWAPLALEHPAVLTSNITEF